MPTWLSISSLRRTFPLAVLGTLAVVYFLTANGRVGLADSSMMLDTTRSFLQGRISLPLDSIGQEGPDGQRYNHYGPLTSVYWIPFVLAARLIHAAVPALPLPLLEEFLVSFSGMPLILALLGYLVWEWRSRGLDEKSIRQGVWLIGLTTLVWPYTKIVTSDLPFALAVLGAWCHGRRSSEWRHAVACGVYLGLALLCRKQAQTVIPIVGLYALLACPRHRVRTSLLGIAAGFVPFLLIQLLYNHARWGSPFLEIYPMTQAKTPDGFIGWLYMIGYNLFGSYQGFFLFNPVLLGLLLLAGTAWWRRERLEVSLLILLMGGQLLLFACFGTLLGPISFGARLLVFMIPLAALAWPCWNAANVPGKNWILALLAGAGFCIQILGVTTDALAAWQRRELAGSGEPILLLHAAELRRVLGADHPSPHPAHPAFQCPDLWWVHAYRYLKGQGD